MENVKGNAIMIMEYRHYSRSVVNSSVAMNWFIQENRHQNEAWGVRFNKDCKIDIGDERKESGYSIRLIKE